MDFLGEGNRLRLGSVDELCAVVGVDRPRLLHIVAHAPKLYDFFVVGEKKREIRPSRRPLKTIQERLSDHFELVKPYSRFAMGGVRYRSIVDHARPHVGKKMVVTLDIQRCFPSTTPEMVERALMKCGAPEEVASLITKLTTTDNQLPQGAPSSTAITNIVLIEMDGAYQRLALRHGLTYTRYVDDIAVSGNFDLPVLRSDLEAPIRAMGYTVSPSKVLFMGDGRKQVVTGLVVNDRLRPTKEWLGDLKRLIRRTWNEDLEVLAAEEDCRTPYHLHQRISGKINHVMRIDGKLGRRIKSLTYRTPWPWRSTGTRGVPSGVHAEAQSSDSTPRGAPVKNRLI